jgi:hypothetical protein
MPLEVFGLCYKTFGAAKSRTKNKARLFRSKTSCINYLVHDCRQQRIVDQE